MVYSGFNKKVFNFAVEILELELYLDWWNSLLCLRYLGAEVKPEVKLNHGSSKLWLYFLMHGLFY